MKELTYLNGRTPQLGDQVFGRLPSGAPVAGTLQRFDADSEMNALVVDSRDYRFLTSVDRLMPADAVFLRDGEAATERGSINEVAELRARLADANHRLDDLREECDRLLKLESVATAAASEQTAATGAAEIAGAARVADAAPAPTEQAPS
jgi:hypothetical protein